jgi:uncharacterized protein (DUF58 family)
MNATRTDDEDTAGDENTDADATADAAAGAETGAAVDDARTAAGRRGESASGESASGESASGESASGESASGESASGESASGESASGESASGESASGESASGESASGESRSGASASADAVAFESETGSARVVAHHETVTNHWEGVAAVTTFTGGVGIVFRSPALLLAAVIGVAFAAYAAVAEPLTVDLAVTRTLSDPDPDLGDEVEVTVHVQNHGSQLVPDLRLVDGVPDSLEVVDGTARVATVLRPGDMTSYTYTVAAKRGTHEFESISAYARGFSGAFETELELEATTTMIATPSLEPTADLPLRQQTSRYAGRVDTNTGGEGIEFHQTREYRTGDSMSRIDWNRHARTGELTTIEFREERAATVVCVLDLRASAYVRGPDDNFHAADHGIDAAGQIFATLLETGDRVGIAALSSRDVWLPPSLGNEHRVRAEELFATHPALSPERPTSYFSLAVGVRDLRQRLPADAQLVVFSPLADDTAAHAARLLHAHGHAVTVISPNPTGDETLGQRIARVERHARLTRLREAGVRVVDWDVTDSLATTLARAERRWSA